MLGKKAGIRILSQQGILTCFLTEAQMGGVTPYVESGILWAQIPLSALPTMTPVSHTFAVSMIHYAMYLNDRMFAGKLVDLRELEAYVHTST